MEVLQGIDLKTELTNLKDSLVRGDQRKIAKLMKSHPNRVSYAFDGFVSDLEFLSRLRNVTKKFLKERPSTKK